jgi:hypothetical protein
MHVDESTWLTLRSFELNNISFDSLCYSFDDFLNRSRRN